MITKNMKRNMFFILAIACMMAGCQPVEDLVDPTPNVTPTDGKYTITIQASKDVGTKALNLDGNTLNAYWDNEEKVYVFKGTESFTNPLSVAPGEPNTTATLSGTISGLAKNDALTLMIPRTTWDYTKQDGTLATIQTKYDYATAPVTVSNVNETTHAITTTAANFQNEQSIYRFSFKASSSATTLLPVKSMKVISANNALVQSRTLGSEGWTDVPGSSIEITVPNNGTATVLYASLRNNRVGTSTNTDTYSIDIIGADNALYVCGGNIPSSVMDAQGKFISLQNKVVSQARFTSNTTSTNQVW